ncbi:MAG: type II toxin-antitoxin system RelE/ParE family toxin [Elusimicrobia bacterium]|nr:type II toxin-antitoxin system RelE/ParE family toxin [Elusimicrobiota bacterium]
MMYPIFEEHGLVFFEGRRGDCPVRDYLRGQSKKVRGHAGWLLEVLDEQGVKLGRPTVGHLGDGIYELRVIVDRQQHRILFFFDHEFIVATNAFLKKSDRVPEAEIIEAKKARLEWGNQRGNR